MENVPEEVRAYQEQFWAEEKTRQAAKEAKKKINPKKQARQEAKLKKPMRAREFEGYARKCGAVCLGGNGRHGVHVVFGNGEARPVPKHPGTLSPGVQRSLLNSIKQFQIASVQA